VQDVDAVAREDRHAGGAGDRREELIESPTENSCSRPYCGGVSWA
jgi:hypothetical protein